MILNLVLQSVAVTVFAGLLLFGAAGTIAWPAGWAYLLILLFSSIWIGAGLARSSPELLQERLKSPIQTEQAPRDRIFMAFLLLVWVAWLVLMGLDAVRWRWSHMPLALQVLGGVIAVVSLYAAYLAMRENRFAAPVVKVQDQQTVIDTGPYGVVRHPMYAGALPTFIGVPLLLGSWWGLAVFPIIAIGIGLRIGVEEQMLRTAFPGYADYAKRVRFRLLPGVW